MEVTTRQNVCELHSECGLFEALMTKLPS